MVTQVNSGKAKLYHIPRLSLHMNHGKHDLGTRLVKLGFTVILVMRLVDLDKVVLYTP